MKTNRIQKSAACLRVREPLWASCCRGARVDPGEGISVSPNSLCRLRREKGLVPSAAPVAPGGGLGQSMVGSQGTQSQVPTAIFSPLKQMIKGHWNGHV